MLRSIIAASLIFVASAASAEWTENRQVLAGFRSNVVSVKAAAFLTSTELADDMEIQIVVAFGPVRLEHCIRYVLPYFSAEIAEFTEFVKL